MDKYKFFYDDCRGRHWITMKRGCPEWANSDCPTIWAINKDDYRDTWMVNSGGLYAEAGQFKELFSEFVEKSSKAFYRKFPELYKGRNGFVENFNRHNEDTICIVS